MSSTDANAVGPGWLLLVYRVPSEPTRLRAAVWRRLKSLGAIYLQNSAAALPASVPAERALRKLRREILDMSGTAVLLSCGVLAGEADIKAAFQAARDDEYEEIVDKCEDFLGQVRKEYVDEHFTYAELEENEVDLVKLRNWFAKVADRDAFGAAGREAAEQGIANCEQTLEEYAARVYAEEAESKLALADGPPEADRQQQHEHDRDQPPRRHLRRVAERVGDRQRQRDRDRDEPVVANDEVVGEGAEGPDPGHVSSLPRRPQRPSAGQRRAPGASPRLGPG